MRRRKFGTILVVPAVVAALCGGLLTPAGAAPSGEPALTGPAQPDGGAAGAEWTATHDGPQQYPGVHVDWDVPITMSDGTVLKSNVYRPADGAGNAVDTKTPVIVNMTPYTKLVSAVADAAVSMPELMDPIMEFTRGLNPDAAPFEGLTELLKAVNGGALRTFTTDQELIKSGYTQVVVDVRGTGFSQGVWQVLQDREQQDTVEVIDWAAAQPFSNGRVGMNGVSYSAINQMQAASRNPNALQAILPVEPGGDLLRDVVAPGGGLGIGFMPAWLLAINGLKFLPDMQALLKGEFDTTWWNDRLESPLTFMDLLWAGLATPTVADIPPALAALLDDQSALRHDLVVRADQITTPTMLYGGWHDLFVNSEPRMYNQIPLPPGEKQLIMGDTYHMNPASAFGETGHPPRLDVLQRAWFDRWLKDIDNGIDGWGPVTMDQIGGGWITADSFPRPGMTHQRMYLSAASSGTSPGSVHDGSLNAAGVGAPAALTITPTLSTLCSRDSAQETMGIAGAFDACSQDSRVAEAGALSFTGAPVTTATAISGPVNVRLNTEHDATDGYWTATLNDVAPDGSSVVLTSGQLTSSLRAIDDAQSGFAPNGDVTDPHYRLTLASRQPLGPGQPVTLDVGLAPIEAVLEPGHRLRVDIFAANLPKGMLLGPMLRESGLKPQRLVLDPNQPSFVNVPLSRPMG